MASKGISYEQEDATRNKCLTSRNKCLTSSNKKATSNKCLTYGHKAWPLKAYLCFVANLSALCRFERYGMEAIATRLLAEPRPLFQATNSCQSWSSTDHSCDRPELEWNLLLVRHLFLIASCYC